MDVKYLAEVYTIHDIDLPIVGKTIHAGYRIIDNNVFYLAGSVCVLAFSASDEK